MAAYDSDIQLTVNLEPGDVVKTAQKLNKDIEKIFSSSKGKQTSATFKSLQNSMNNILQKSEQLQRSMAALEGQKFNTEQFTTLSSELEKARASLEKLIEKRDTIKDKSIPLFENADKIKADINATNEKLTELNEKLAELKKSGTYVSGIKLPEFKKVDNSIAEVQAKLDALRNKEPTDGYLNSKQFDKDTEMMVKLSKELDFLKQKRQEMIDSGKAYKTGIKASDLEEMQKINAEIDQVKQQLVELQDEEDKATDEIVNKWGPSFREASAACDQLSTSISNMENEQQNMINSGTAFVRGEDTEEYHNLAESLNSVNNQMVIYKQRAKEASKTGGFFTGAIKEAFNLVSTLNSVHSRINQIAVSATQLLGSGLQRGLQGLGSLARNAFSGIISGAQTTISHINSLRKSFLQFISNKILGGLSTIKNSLLSIGKSAKKSNGGLNVGFKTFLRYGLGIRSVYMLVNKLRRALLDGFKNLAQSNEEFNQAMSTITSSLNWIKNSFAAAFAPLVEYVAPIIADLAAKLVNVIRLSGQFIAALTGKDMMEAQYVYTDYAESLDNSSKSTSRLDEKTKKLKKTLAGFDDVEILKDKDDDEEKKLDYSFTPATIDPGTSSLIDMLKEKFLGLIDVIKQAWELMGSGLLTSIKNAFEAIKKLLATIGDTFHKVFTEGYGFNWLVSVFGLLSTIFDIITAIATVFAQAWSDNGRGYAYVASIFAMFESINNLLITIGQTFIRAWNDGGGYDLISAILWAFTNIHIMIMSIANALREAWNNNDVGYTLISAILLLFSEIFYTIGDIAKTFADAFNSPIGVQTISGILELFVTIVNILSSITSAFRDAWNDNHAGYRYVESLFFAIDRIRALLEVIGKSFLKVWDGGAVNGKDIMEELIGLFTTINTTIGEIANSFKLAWEDNGRGEEIIGKILAIFYIILGTINHIASDFGEIFSSTAGQEMLDNLLESFDKILGAIRSITDDFRNAWSSRGKTLLSAIVGLFDSVIELIGTVAENFKTAWDNGAANGQVIFESIIETFTEIVGAITDVTNSFNVAFSDEEGRILIEKILLLFNGAWETLKQIAVAFRKAWNDNKAGETYVKSLRDLFTEISTTLESIRTAFDEAWKDEDNGAVLIALILKTFKDINTAIGDASAAFKIAWEDGGHGEELIGNIGNAFEGIIRLIDQVAQDFSKMLTSGPGEEAIAKILEALNSVAEFIEGLTTSFANAWQDDNAGYDYIKSIADLISGIPELLGNVLSSFTQAWSEGGKGEGIIQDMINTATNFNNTILGYKDSFIQAWNEADAGKQLFSDLLDAIKPLADSAASIQESIAEWASNIDFGPLIGAFDSLAQKIEPVTKLIGETLKSAYDDVLLPLGSWTIEEALPGILEALASAIDILSIAFGSIKRVFTPFWNDILKPIFDTFGDIIVEVVGKIKDKLDEFATWMNEHQEIVDLFVEVLGDFALAWLGQKGLGAAVGTIEKVFSALGTLAGGFDPVSLGISALIGAGILFITHLDEVKEAVGKAKTWIVNKFEVIKTSLGEKVDYIKDTLGERWKTFCDGTTSGISQLKEDAIEWFGNIKDDCGDAIETLASLVTDNSESMKNGMLDHVKSMWANASLKFRDIKDDVTKKFTAAADTTSEKFTAIKDSIVDNLIFGAAVALVQTGLVKDDLDMEQTVKDVKEKFESLPGKIKEGIGSLVGIGEQIINDILTGLQSKFDDIQNWFNNLGTLIGNWIKDTVAKASNIPGLITDWISGKVDEAAMTVNTFGSLVVDAFRASGGFVKNGQIFVARESGPELVGKMGNANAVANNQQIVDGIKNGVTDALSSVSSRINDIGYIASASYETIEQLQALNNTLTLISQQSPPLVAQGKVLPASFSNSGAMTQDLSNIREMLEYQAGDSISKEELRTLLIDVARNYISSSFYLGDEQIARHANNGNLKLARIYGLN